MVDCYSPALNLPSIPINDSFRPNKISWYTPNILPYEISVAYVNSASIFTTPYYLPQFILLTPYAPYTYHIIIRNKPGHAIGKIG